MAVNNTAAERPEARIYRVVFNGVKQEFHGLFRLTQLSQVMGISMANTSGFRGHVQGLFVLCDGCLFLTGFGQTIGQQMMRSVSFYAFKASGKGGFIPLCNALTERFDCFLKSFQI